MKYILIEGGIDIIVKVFLSYQLKHLLIVFPVVKHVFVLRIFGVVREFLDQVEAIFHDVK